MNLLVTGCFGFIGFNFINNLLKEKGDDFNIIGIDSLESSCSAYNKESLSNTKNFTYYKTNINEIKDHNIQNVDLIINFAAESHVDNSIKNGRPFVRTNVEGTFNLLECAKQNPNLKKFIHISTDEVYGDMADIGLLAEANESYNLTGSSYYSATKAASDLLVEACGRTFGLPYIITRTCNNYGSHQNPEKFIPKIMKSIAEDLTVPVYGDGRQVREWIDVEDNVQLIYELMLSDLEGEVYNIGSGERYENIEILNMIGEMLGKTPKFEFVEDRLGHDKRYALDSTRGKEVFSDWHTLSFHEFLLEQIHTLKQKQEAT